MSIFGNLDGTFRNRFSFGKPKDDVYFERDSSDLKLRDLTVTTAQKLVDLISRARTSQLSGLTAATSAEMSDLLLLELASGGALRKITKEDLYPANVQTCPIMACDSTVVNPRDNDRVLATAVIPERTVKVNQLRFYLAVLPSPPEGALYGAIYNSSLNKVAEATSAVYTTSLGFKTVTLTSTATLNRGSLYYFCCRCTSNPGPRLLGHSNTNANLGSDLTLAFRDNDAGEHNFPSSLTIDVRESEGAWIEAIAA